ncbi:protein GLUTAMINE DUMPER 5-like [Populus alba x Populus x berolinensis]|uniref:Protein GLUTAMINE DUMPER 5-like n=3 Tax=Populus TaxID=3689 RepID=A0A4U5QND0_POPAL|nr:protein GLUTAMINE DUMPER 5-like [Populus alba]KAJ6995274.1 protein GLUTAMINE DUMPER 5-like [Populus alba x Populus x berolinensis]TKS11789.1 protein GLUTAMINE DUMPER 5-like [Populus alba]
MRPISHLDTTMSTSKAAATSPSPPAIAQPRSAWHSPVPYLFGGLAAMLGLIAFALLILACSYWRLSGRLDSENEGNDQRDLESGNEKEGSNPGKAEKRVYEEKFLVIMAGNENPTCLATPVCSKVSSFVAQIDNQEEEKTENTGDDHYKLKNEETIRDSHDQARTTAEENIETQENQQEVQEEQN